VANTVQSTASHIVTIDYHSGVNTRTQITFGSRTFQVEGFHNPDERNIQLVLACKEVVS
jgi:head-tail adaptor